MSAFPFGGTTPSRIRNRLLAAVVLLLLILGAGTAGYWLQSGGRRSPMDCLYMTFITVTTIGFGEIFDLSDSPWGRVLTMFIALSGIGTMTYILANASAFIIEGDLGESFRRRKMDKRIEALQDHYIVCGLEGAALYVIEELFSTGRPCVLVGAGREDIAALGERYGEPLWVEGDPTDDGTLGRAGLGRARGLFAVTGDDNHNLVITLTARQLNPAVRIVARADSTRNIGKMRKAGADSVVSPSSIGGLRMASEMLRPTAVSFLDVMLRPGGDNLRIEEAAVPAGFAGRDLASLDLQKRSPLLLLAVRSGDRWHYNPPPGRVLGEGDVLVFMSSPEERVEVERIFAGEDRPS